MFRQNRLPSEIQIDCLAINYTDNLIISYSNFSHATVVPSYVINQLSMPIIHTETEPFTKNTCWFRHHWLMRGWSSRVKANGRHLVRSPYTDITDCHFLYYVPRSLVTKYIECFYRVLFHILMWTWRKFYNAQKIYLYGKICSSSS